MSVFSIEHSCIDPARNNLSLIKTAAISAKKYFEKRAAEHRTFELCLENWGSEKSKETIEKGVL